MNPKRPQPPIQGAAAAPRRLTSQALLAGADEVVIVHQGADYRLRVTRQGKLILTK